MSNRRFVPVGFGVDALFFVAIKQFIMVAEAKAALAKRNLVLFHCASSQSYLIRIAARLRFSASDSCSSGCGFSSG